MNDTERFDRIEYLLENINKHTTLENSSYIILTVIVITLVTNLWAQYFWSQQIKNYKSMLIILTIVTFVTVIAVAGVRHRNRIAYENIYS